MASGYKFPVGGAQQHAWMRESDIDGALARNSTLLLVDPRGPPVLPRPTRRQAELPRGREEAPPYPVVDKRLRLVQILHHHSRQPGIPIPEIKRDRATRWSSRETPPRVVELVPPPNYSEVMPDLVYRSGFPQDENLAFLAGERTRTVLCLVDKPASPNFEAVAARRPGFLRRICLPIAPNKDGKVSTSLESMTEAVVAILTPAHHPIHIHCNQGKHRTGCVIACLRKCQGWDLDDVLEEYSRFAGDKVRDGDKLLIRAFDPRSILPHMLPIVEICVKLRHHLEPPSVDLLALVQSCFTYYDPALVLMAQMHDVDVAEGRRPHIAGDEMTIVWTRAAVCRDERLRMVEAMRAAQRREWNGLSAEEMDVGDEDEDDDMDDWWSDEDEDEDEDEEMEDALDDPSEAAEAGVPEMGDNLEGPSEKVEADASEMDLFNEAAYDGANEASDAEMPDATADAAQTPADGENGQVHAVYEFTLTRTDSTGLNTPQACSGDSCEQ